MGRPRPGVPEAATHWSSLLPRPQLSRHCQPGARDPVGNHVGNGIFFFFCKLQGARGVPGLIDQPVMTSGRKELRIKQEMLRRAEGQTGIPKNKGPKENAASLG